MSKPKTARTGHNSIAADVLKAIVERVEKLEEERSNLASDIRDIFAEAKGHGYDVKTIRRVIKLRKIEEADRLEQEALEELYKTALGMGAAILE